jgi:hypothetical protein
MVQIIKTYDIGKLKLELNDLLNKFYNLILILS